MLTATLLLRIPIAFVIGVAVGEERGWYRGYNCGVDVGIHHERRAREQDARLVRAVRAKLKLVK